MTAFFAALGEAGLVQFGRFEQPDGAIWPVAVRLEWLPSYPALLQQAAAAVQPLLAKTDVDRLLTTQAAIPLGVALSLRSGLPMVYPYGAARDYTAAYVIEGAYDVGHPTVLLANMLVDATQADAITAVARKVGLDVGAVLAVLDLDLGARQALETSGYAVHCVGTLRGALDALGPPPLMRAAVEQWLEEGAK